MQCIFDHFLFRAYGEIPLKGQISIRWTMIFSPSILCVPLYSLFFGCVYGFVLIVFSKTSDEMVGSNRAGITRSYASGLQILCL